MLEKAHLERQIKKPPPWFQYLQLSHLVNQLSKSEHLQPNLTEFEKLIYLGMIGHKGLISTIYKLLLTPIMNKLLLYTNYWIKDGISAY